MNEANEKQLYERFPQLFRDSDKTLMRWGVATGDGWFQILFKLCEDIEAVCEEKRIFKGGSVRFSQIKEKFGTLTVYVDKGFPEIYALINAAAEESATTCETCGKPGEMRRTSWFHVACDSCEAERKKEVFE